MARPKRSEVPVDVTWDLSDLFQSPAEWEEAFSSVQQDLPQVTQYRGRLGESAQTLLACLEAEESFGTRLQRVQAFASLRLSTDGSSQENQAASTRAAGLQAQVSAQLAFLRTEILALPEGVVERFLQEEPRLQEFGRALGRLLEDRPHVLGGEAESALAALGEALSAPQMIYNRAKSSDMQFGPFTDGSGRERTNSFALYEDEFELAADPMTRRNAFASFVEGLRPYRNTFAAAFATDVRKNVVLSRVRNYESATQMLLAPQEVPVSAYHAQLDIIQQELSPHMQRYARLRQRVLGLDELRYCDLKAPLDPEFVPEISFAEASDTIIKALSVLGDEYTEIMRTGLQNRWVDLADNVGKSTGAFCSTIYGVHPYILITWTGTMRSMFVLAHELGHAGHGVLAGRSQRRTNTRASLYFIEAPSTCNEMLLANYLMKTVEDARMRRWVIMQTLGTYHHNFITHLLEGELQRRLYGIAEQGQAITSQTLSRTQGDILRQFWGDTLKVDEGAELTWMRQPHYYMGLYPYTYSAGLTISTAAAQAIEREGQPAVDRWLSALRAGGTLQPMDLIRLSGVDMTTPEPVHEAVRYVGSLVDELERSFA